MNGIILTDHTIVIVGPQFELGMTITHKIENVKFLHSRAVYLKYFKFTGH